MSRRTKRPRRHVQGYSGPWDDKDKTPDTEPGSGGFPRMPTRRPQRQTIGELIAHDLELDRLRTRVFRLEAVIFSVVGAGILGGIVKLLW